RRRHAPARRCDAGDRSRRSHAPSRLHRRAHAFRQRRGVGDAPRPLRRTRARGGARGGRARGAPSAGGPRAVDHPRPHRRGGRAGERLAEAVPPPNLAQQIAGASVALADLARAGITSVHDVARLEEVSQRTFFHTFVERSATDLALFRALQAEGVLSVRVYAFLTLPLWRETIDAGIRPRTDEGRIRFGALKAFIDGFLMDEDYADRPGDRGDFTFRFVDEATMAADIAGADAAGFDPVVHCVGDRAHRLLLDWYEAAIHANPARDRRFRVIHAR